MSKKSTGCFSTECWSLWGLFDAIEICVFVWVGLLLNQSWIHLPESSKVKLLTLGSGKGTTENTADAKQAVQAADA